MPQLNPLPTGTGMNLEFDNLSGEEMNEIELIDYYDS